MRAINLLPDGYRSGPRAGSSAKGGAYVVVGVLGVVLLMAVMYTLTANKASSATSKAAETKQEADRADAELATLGSFGDFASSKQTRVSAVQTLASSAVRLGAPPARAVGRAAEGRLAPDDRRLRCRGGGCGAAAAAQPGTPAAAPQPTAELVGCTPASEGRCDLAGSPAAALPRGRGEASSSRVRGEPDVDPSPENCGRLVKFDVGVTFKGSAPVGSEVPKGEKRVPVSLGGGS